MKLVIFGLTLSSSWGNGHATVWRSLLSALSKRGYHIVFFEADVPYYAEHRDLPEPSFAKLHLYSSWRSIADKAKLELADADVAIVSSYCADAVAASQIVLSSRARARVFYDLDTPVTLRQLSSDCPPPYLPAHGLADFDLVLSFTGGPALDELRSRLGAQRVSPLYGSVDPCTYHPVGPVAQYRCDLSYLGTFAADRQTALERLFVTTAEYLPNCRFVLAGALYPLDFPWKPNLWHVPHVPPRDHAQLYCSSRATLNVTRAAMATMGYCPSGRLFEAAACGTLMLSDDWAGMDQFFTRGTEILIVNNADDVIAALSLSEREQLRIAREARERVLEFHIGHKRALEFESAVAAVM
ncbi:MAG TPA: glycosyltransferase [Candidatus Binataceae bacterium]|nr:glycosyltransferase [Candidatus Binataceae bacterium]